MIKIAHLLFRKWGDYSIATWILNGEMVGSRNFENLHSVGEKLPFFG